MIQETVPVDTSLGQELGNLIHNSVRVKIPSKKAVLTNAGKSPPRVGRQNLIAHNVNLEWHTARLWPTDCPPGHKHKRQNSYAAAATSAHDGTSYFQMINIQLTATQNNSSGS